VQRLWETPAQPDHITCAVLERIDGAPRKLDCAAVQFTPVATGAKESEEEPDVVPFGSRSWYLYFTSALCCVTVAALAAGMTLGFTSLDPFHMQVLSNCVPEDLDPRASPTRRDLNMQKLKNDQEAAQIILPVISGHFFGSCRKGTCQTMPKVLNPSNEHYLLVTLLLANAAANEALPIFLDRLVPAWLAVLLSVTVVLIFGEIIPSAIFTGPNQLRLAAAMCCTIQTVMVVLMPIVWPIALALDCFLGHHAEEHSRSELKAMVRTLRAECLEKSEESIIQGVLELHRKCASDIAKPLEDAKMIQHDAVLDADCIKDLQACGHSRLFVYRRNPEHPEDRTDIVGVLLVKKLLGIEPSPTLKLNTLDWALKQPVVLGLSDNLLDVLNKFQKGQSHLAMAAGDERALLGALRDSQDGGTCIPHQARPTKFCSLEDVIEEMLKEQIYDEEDLEHGRDHSMLRQLTRSMVSTESFLVGQRRLRSVLGGSSLGMPSSTVEIVAEGSSSSSSSSSSEE